MPGITSQVATNDFLNLLTVQLKNQDPIEPVNQEDFIAQLAQFSQLEQTEALNSNFEQLLETTQLTQGMNLVGKQASYTDAVTGEKKTGLVEELIANSGPANLLINGERVGLNLISGVTI
ncbi:MAG: flagellar hook capping protein [Planctomycetaceae bacterium]|jgi:flagellar basal-body rod modification protein FlgD|nr:flagellar hook capping protein [Planctomycetaceae bacterium]MCP4478118.1 flagellar hook capping protein [Planctomycetaceae bacterium]MCP4779148.1 flagellar hook capping protein [Planctomycetaceae bacterium]